jgi:hypothetical protein
MNCLNNSNLPLCRLRVVEDQHVCNTLIRTVFMTGRTTYMRYIIMYKELESGHKLLAVNSQLSAGIPVLYGPIGGGG